MTTAIQLLADFPRFLLADMGRDVIDPDAWSDFAGIVQLEGVLDGLTDTDQRHVVAATAMDAYQDGPEKVRWRAGWIRESEEGRAPLTDPEGCAVAFERLADLMEMKF